MLIRSTRMVPLLLVTSMGILCAVANSRAQTGYGGNLPNGGDGLIIPGSTSVDLSRAVPVNRRKMLPPLPIVSLPTPANSVTPNNSDEFISPTISVSQISNNTQLTDSPVVQPPTAAVPAAQTPAPLLQTPSTTSGFSDPMSVGHIGQHPPIAQDLSMDTGFLQSHVPPAGLDSGMSTFANGIVFSSDPGRQELINPYLQRVQQYDSQPFGDDQDASANMKPIPGTYVPWWAGNMVQGLRNGVMPVAASLDDLTVAALQYSPKIRAIKIDPEMRLHTVVAEDAEFDWRAYLDTTWDDTSDPVGNTLTTGGSPRFRDNRFATTGGVRKRTRSGGELDISQRFGFQDNNSLFFVPGQQGTAQLSLNYTHPLARESGRVYNRSRIVLASIEQGVSQDELIDGLQEHLLEVTQSYWELYRSRAVYLQKKKLLKQAISIQSMLEGRKKVDSVRRQVLRSRAAVASRKSEIARAAMAIRNSESRLRQLVNDPRLTTSTRYELLPKDVPVSYFMPMSMAESLHVGLTNRTDIARAVKAIRATTVRMGVAKNEIMPKLDLVLGTYLSGLEGGSDINLAWGNQFHEGEPSYSIGLLFEVPLGNRGATARLRRRELELQKSVHEFRNSVETAITDVEISVRESQTSHKEITSRYHSMMAAATEAEYLSERWKILPGSDRTTSFMLEDLLDAQERVADEELEFVTAQVNYMLALADAKRATGMLLQNPTHQQYTPSTDPQPPEETAPVEGTEIPVPRYGNE